MVKTDSIKEEVTIPDNVEITYAEGIITVKGEKGTISRQLIHPKIKMVIKNNILEISCTNSPKKKEKALVGTFVAHSNNLIKGVTEGFEYKMKTVFSHFPIKTIVEGNEFVIQNFLGERSPRRAVILEGVEVTTKDDAVTVTGIDKEKVGQTAANIERATKVKKRDIRVFQDGVYIISKKG